MQVRDARPADAAAIAHVHVDSWRTTYKGTVPDDYLARLSSAHRQQMWEENPRAATPTRVLMAEDAGGRIVGFAARSTERSGDPLYRGELYAIYLLDSYQHRGIGRDLFAAVVGHLIGQGMDGMLIWVLAANPSRRFYDAMGGRPVRQQHVEIGGATLEEVAYGWHDLHALRR